MQANPWMHFQFLKTLGIAFHCVAEVLPAISPPCHIGIAEYPYDKGVNSSKTAYDCIYFMFSACFNNKSHSFR